MNNFIFDKTDKGREEIATRQYQLATRLRTLLVLIDGKQTTDNLLKKVSGLGLNDQSIEELLDNGFIQGISNETAAPRTVVSAISGTVLGDRRGTGLPAADPRTLSNGNIVLREGEHPFQALHSFFNETIKSTLGLRGIKLQYKASRANSIEDFRNLRAMYIEAVRAAKGEEMAQSLQERLDQLIKQAAWATQQAERNT